MQVGGMADVVTALGRAVKEAGHNVKIIIPKYDVINYAEVSHLSTHARAKHIKGLGTFLQHFVAAFQIICRLSKILLWHMQSRSKGVSRSLRNRLFSSVRNDLDPEDHVNGRELHCS